MRILAADIGGSQSRLLLAELEGEAWRTLRRHTFPSPDFASVEALLDGFLAGGEAVAAACLAVAGPVASQRVALTNLPWIVDAAALATRFGLRQVRIVNDFAAQAHGLPALDADGICTLQAGAPVADGLRALMGAGTGLGVALLAGPDAHPRALPSEGGHADFAPRNAEEMALVQDLLPRHGRISLETLLCGRGLERLYRRAAGLADDAPASARAIGEAALAGEPAARDAVALFGRLLGAAAGNLALTSLALGGVYLSGGITPKLLPLLRDGGLREAFCDKPPMRALMERIPLHVVTDELLGLKGAAQLAARLARGLD
ncbi:putative glucokinase [Azoarcus olearius]|uniref:glucokinase n=1 Tax=Azoarcus sp. (strain BH72) TaxID=418699 RepID=UPI0008063D42|nr:glucokinase [Azoarcus olearius]ANQ85473.1 putative glucokinase [Azoarcus olearius]